MITEQEKIMYEIGILNGQQLKQNEPQFNQEYVDRLGTATHQVSLSLTTTTTAEKLQQQHQGRRRAELVYDGWDLAVTDDVDIVTSAIPCPLVQGVDNTTFCESVTATVGLVWTASDGTTTTVPPTETFESDFRQDLALGKLQTELDGMQWSTVPSNPIIILTGLPPIEQSQEEGRGVSDISPSSDDIPKQERLIISSVTLVAAGLLVLLSLLVQRRRRPSDQSHVRALEDETAKETDKGVLLETAALDLGADLLVDAADIGQSGDNNSQDDDAFQDEQKKDEAPKQEETGQLYARPRLTADMIRRIADVEQQLPDKQRQVVDANEWAAVGGTAALLANMSDSQSGWSTSSYVSSSSAAGSNRSRHNSREEERLLESIRAAELDDLVETEDWEGLAAAVSRYQDEDTKRISTGR